MTDAQSEPQGTGQAPPLTLNLSSNNPFRNRAVSPSAIPKGPGSPFDDPPRPVSRNPFLDPNSKPSDDMATKDRISPTAEEIFDNLTLDDKGPNKERRLMPPPGRGPPRGPPGPAARGGGPPRDRENMPPPGRRMPPRHRPTRSQEEALRARRMQGGSSGGPSGSMSPNRRSDRRPRRNSESSIASGDRIMTEEEKKQRDARRRERERRHRERDTSGSKDSKDKPAKSNKRMDIIDQLDATSIFGTGLFHHDGPFDALNPHRNRQGSRRAPMQAFPKDSLNNVLGGSGPLNARPDHATFMGTAGEEGYKDYNNGIIPSDKMGSSSHMPPVFDPLSRSHVLHGDVTLGLGTSTFLEGTPAARSTVQRREAEKAQETQTDGLQRKKSLAQRIRGINSRPQRDFSASGRMTNPEGAMRSPPLHEGATSSSYGGPGERNPFFNEYSKGGEENISIRRADTIGLASPMSPGSPGPANTRGMGASLERRATADAMASEEQPRSTGGGLLARVKSLKGGRRTRPAEPTAAAPPPPPAGRDA